MQLSSTATADVLKNFDVVVLATGISHLASTAVPSPDNCSIGVTPREISLPVNTSKVKVCRLETQYSPRSFPLYACAVTSLQSGGVICRHP